MIARVVGNHHDLTAAFLANLFEFLQKIPTGDRIEHTFGAGHDELTVSESHGSEETDALAGRGMTTHRIEYLRWNPQATSRAMLLEMHLIDRPQIDAGISRQAAEFF